MHANSGCGQMEYTPEMHTEQSVMFLFLFFLKYANHIAQREVSSSILKAFFHVCKKKNKF